MLQLVPDFDPNKTMMLFPFGGSVVKRPTLHTVDIKPEANPTFCLDVTDRRQVRSNLDDTYDLVLIDPPDDSDNVTYSSKLHGTRPLRPYGFMNSDPRMVNIGEKARISGVIAILNQLVYKILPRSVRLGLLSITTGPHMRMRALNHLMRGE